MEYLDFELPIKELEQQLDKCSIIGKESDIDVTDTCKQIEKKLIQTKKEIYKNLTMAKSAALKAPLQAIYFRLY